MRSFLLSRALLLRLLLLSALRNFSTLLSRRYVCSSYGPFSFPSLSALCVMCGSRFASYCRAPPTRSIRTPRSTLDHHGCTRRSLFPPRPPRLTSCARAIRRPANGQQHEHSMHPGGWAKWLQADRIGSPPHNPRRVASLRQPSLPLASSNLRKQLSPEDAARP